MLKKKNDSSKECLEHIRSHIFQGLMLVIVGQSLKQEIITT